MTDYESDYRKPVSLMFIIMVLVCCIAATFGYGTNIMAILNTPFDPMTGKLVARLVGVFIVPLGVLMGFVR